MRIKLHFQAAAATKQRFKRALANVEAAFFRECIGIRQAFLGAAGMPAAFRNLYYRNTVRRVKFSDSRWACEPVRRVKRLEQEGTPATGFGRRAVLGYFSLLVFAFVRLCCSSS